jgi:formamidopyrimidine-DNA glycosylase
MPELPEVELIKLQLDKYLYKHKIEKVEVRNSKVFQGNPKNLIGGKFTRARRFGKIIVADFNNGFSFVAHVKLTGQFIYRGPNLKKPPKLSKKVTGGIPGKHTHVIFYLDKEGILYYNDVRRFGWIKVVKTEEVENIDFIKKLGPEPLNGLTPEMFFRLISSTKRAVKVVIMDQSKIGGVGNIYANDALWLAKINPKRAANSLSEEETQKLYKAIEEVLKRGLKWGGASELSFVAPDGSEGEYQNHTLVYGRDGEICQNCHKEKIRKFFLNGRGTYFCPNCQK